MLINIHVESLNLIIRDLQEHKLVTDRATMTREIYHLKMGYSKLHHTFKFCLDVSLTFLFFASKENQTAYNCVNNIEVIVNNYNNYLKECTQTRMSTHTSTTRVPAMNPDDEITLMISCSTLYSPFQPSTKSTTIS